MEAKKRNFNNFYVTIVFKSSSPDWFIKFISGVIDLGGTMLIASFRTSPSPPPNHPQSEDKPCKPANQPANDRKWEWETHCWGAGDDHACRVLHWQQTTEQQKPAVSRTHQTGSWKTLIWGSIYIYIYINISIFSCVLCGFCTRIELMVNWKE